MSKYATKYFGEISIDETSDFEFIEVNYKNKDITISLSDCNMYGGKLKECLEILDNYIEINEKAKKAIVENFPGNEIVRYYFECHFDIFEEEQIAEIFGVKTFAEFDIKKAAANLNYPNLLFDMDGGELNFSVDYNVSEEYSDEILCVKMDGKMNITGFSHES